MATTALNISSEARDDMLYHLNEDTFHKLLPVISIFAVLAVVGAIGNSLSIYILAVKMRRNFQNNLFLLLSAASLSACSVCIPTDIVDMRYDYLYPSELLCKMTRFFNTYVTVTSGLSLLVVAVYRYKAVSDLRYRDPWSSVVILVILVSTTSLAGLSAVVYGMKSSPTYVPGIMGRDCSIADDVSQTNWPLVFNFTLALGFAALVLTTTVCYYNIWKIVKLSGSAVTGHRTSETGPELDPGAGHLTWDAQDLGTMRDTQTPEVSSSQSDAGNAEKYPKENSTNATHTQRSLSSHENHTHSCDTFEKRHVLARSPRQYVARESPSSVIFRDSGRDVTTLQASSPNLVADSLNDASEVGCGGDQHNSSTTSPIHHTTQNLHGDCAKRTDVKTGSGVCDASLTPSTSAEQPCPIPESHVTGREIAMSQTLVKQVEAVSKREAMRRSQKKPNSVEPATHHVLERIGTKNGITSTQRRSKEAESIISRTAFLLTFTFILSYTPFFLVSIPSAFIKDFGYTKDSLKLNLINLGIRFYWVTPVINPFIYWMSNMAFRRACMTLLVRDAPTVSVV